MQRRDSEKVSIILFMKMTASDFSLRASSPWLFTKKRGMGRVVHEVRAVIGPKDVDVAKEEAPDT